MRKEKKKKNNKERKKERKKERNNVSVDLQDDILHIKTTAECSL